MISKVLPLLTSFFSFRNFPNRLSLGSLPLTQKRSCAEKKKKNKPLKKNSLKHKTFFQAKNA